MSEFTREEILAKVAAKGLACVRLTWRGPSTTPRQSGLRASTCIILSLCLYS